MAEKTLQQDTRTFQIHPRRRLIAAALSVAIAVVIAVGSATPLLAWSPDAETDLGRGKLSP